MSDSNFTTFFRWGTQADRLAFTPNPPVIAGNTVPVLYQWFETDNVPDFYLFIMDGVIDDWVGPYQVATPATSGLTLLQSYHPSGAASVDITSVLSSTYDKYLISIDDMSFSNNGVTAKMLVSVDNGANWHASTYHWSSLAYPTGSGTGLAPFSDGDTSWQIGGGYSGGGAGLGSGANYAWEADIRVSNVNGSRFKIFKGTGSYAGNQANTSGIQETFGGSWETVTAVNALQVKPSAGTLTGNLYVFGYQKS